MIDTERILDPQFDDAVIYLTGAQIEMLRNVTQYLNRLDTYVSEQFLDYYLAPTVEDYDSILAIVADLEESLMGNPNTIWGYYDRLYIVANVISTGEGITVWSSDPVPAGYVYHIEHFGIVQRGDATCGIIANLDVDGTYDVLYHAPNVPIGEYISEYCRLTLKEDDVFMVQFIGLADTEDAYVKLWGYVMKVPE
jgi:hypothetical protein